MLKNGHSGPDSCEFHIPTLSFCVLRLLLFGGTCASFGFGNPCCGCKAVSSSEVMDGAAEWIDYRLSTENKTSKLERNDAQTGENKYNLFGSVMFYL